MDERLDFWRGRRVGRLRQPDLPALALAITGHSLKQTLAWRLDIGGQDMVRVYRDDGQFSFYIRGEDWSKIIPYLREGFFNPVVVAIPRPVQPEGQLVVDLVDIPRRDRLYYERVLGTLQVLFPDDYPNAT